VTPKVCVGCTTCTKSSPRESLINESVAQSFRRVLTQVVLGIYKPKEEPHRENGALRGEENRESAKYCTILEK